MRLDYVDYTLDESELTIEITVSDEYGPQRETVRIPMDALAEKLYTHMARLIEQDRRERARDDR